MGREGELEAAAQGEGADGGDGGDGEFGDGCEGRAEVGQEGFGSVMTQEEDTKKREFSNDI